MSLHRFFVPPPLGLALHPAPVAKPSEKRTEKSEVKTKKNDIEPHPQAEKKAKDQANGKQDKPHDATRRVDEKQESQSVQRGEEQKPSPALSEEDASKTSDGEPPKASLRLVSLAPARPIRVKLDLDPTFPYPPINTDPRGAYYKYAKVLQEEYHLIDITKAGWLNEQWRELPERDALAKLRGETKRMQERQIEEVTRRSKLRKVPHTTRELLLDLWNDLAVVDSHECEADDFWNRYDWSDPQAHIHLAPIKEGSSLSPDIEWTREGVEETLASVGVQLSYNTEKPLPRIWAEPSGAYLVLGHGFFMLRLENVLQWKPADDATQKFEMLVTSANDRVLGDMVKAQQAAERKKKELAYRERKLAEKMKGEQDKVKLQSKAVDGQPGKLGPDDAEKSASAEKDKKPQPARQKHEGQVQGAEGGKPKTGKQNAPGVQHPAGKEGPPKPSGREQQRKAELLGKMLASGDPPAGMKMEDVQMAIKTLEAVSQQKTEDKKPVIWVWHDSCERWRWRCFEAGLPLVSPGGWEERDWKVFADDRGCNDFVTEEGWAEDEEEDIHDWSC